MKDKEILIDKVKPDRYSFCNKINNCFKGFSVGQYRTPLFFKKNDRYSSIYTSVASIIMIMLFLTTTIFILIPIFNKQVKDLKYQAIPLSYVRHLNL